MLKTSYKVPNFIFSSPYAQKMRKLQCKIFNEYYIPEMAKKDLEYGIQHQPCIHFTNRWFSEARVIERAQDLPRDLNQDKIHKYYPAHPQIRLATHILREYGLFRDEHRDFNEAMKQIAKSRGKVFRERRGPISSAKKKK